MAKPLADLLDQVFDHPHPHGSSLVVHLVAEFIDEEPDHVQANGFIVELGVALGTAYRLLLDRARRHAADLDLEPAGAALEDQLQLPVATSPPLGGGGGWTL